MKQYLLLPVFFFSMALFGACVVTPLAPTATPAAMLTPDATLATTVATTATESITIAVTLTATPAITPTAAAAITDTLVVTATPVLTPTAAVTAPELQEGSIAALVAARPDLTMLNSAIAAVNLTDELNADTTFYTLFAPTDDAFAALPADVVDTLLASPTLLTSVLQNHLLIEDVDAAGLVRLGTVLSAFGETLPITLTADGMVQIGDATVVEADITATNGVIHTIDTVLLPAGLVITPTVATATAVTTTTAATTTQLITTTAEIVTMDTAAMTIGDVISATADLEMLETALGAAGLLPALQVPGELTIFAPTNAAFEAIPADQLQTLLNTTGQLAPVLQYHLVADNVLAADLVRLGSALSTSSQPITITATTTGTVLVNNAQVVQADIVTTNGVIHLIDAVLMPPAQ
jgi:transforming growth factor-beta-induced protein